LWEVIPSIFVHQVAFHTDQHPATPHQCCRYNIMHNSYTCKKRQNPTGDSVTEKPVASPAVVALDIQHVCVHTSINDYYLGVVEPSGKTSGSVL
jgi:hypothetical protein